MILEPNQTPTVVSLSTLNLPSRNCMRMQLLPTPKMKRDDTGISDDDILEQIRVAVHHCLVYLLQVFHLYSLARSQMDDQFDVMLTGEEYHQLTQKIKDQQALNLVLLEENKHLKALLQPFTESVNQIQLKNASIKELSKQVLSVVHKLMLAESKCDELMKSNNKLIISIQEQDKLHSLFKESSDKNRSSLETAIRESESSKDDITRLEREMELSKQNSLHTTHQNRLLNQQKQTLHQEKQALNQEKEAFKIKYDNCILKHSKLDEEHQGLLQEKENLMKENLMFKSESKVLKDEGEALKQCNRFLKESQEAMKQMNATLSKKIEEQERFSLIVKESVQTERKHFQAEINNLKGQIRQLLNPKSQILEYQSNPIETIAELETEITELRRKIHESEIQTKSIKKLYVEMQEKIKLKEKATIEMAENAANKIKELEQQVKQIKTFELFEGELAELEQKNIEEIEKRKKEEIQNLKAMLSEAQEHIDNLQIVNESLQKQKKLAKGKLKNENWDHKIQEDFLHNLEDLKEKLEQCAYSEKELKQNLLSKKNQIFKMLEGAFQHVKVKK